MPLLLALVACGVAQEPPPLEFERVEIDAGADPHVLAAELTGDGHPDLAVAGEGRVLILAGDGSGGFRRAGRADAGENPTGLAAADLDGDGVIDLATPNERAVGVRLGRDGREFGTLRELEAAPVAPYGLTAADVNGDGWLDLAASSGEGGEGVAVLLGDGAGGFRAAPGSPYPAARGFSALAAGDLDADGRADLAVTSWDSPELAVLYGASVASAEDRSPPLQRVEVGENPWFVSAADFDGDGRDDLAVAVHGEDRVVVLLGRDPGE